MGGPVLLGDEFSEMGVGSTGRGSSKTRSVDGSHAAVERGGSPVRPWAHGGPVRRRPSGVCGKLWEGRNGRLDPGLR